jgi:hypothetical protein
MCTGELPGDIRKLILFWHTSLQARLEGTAKAAVFV